METRGDGYAVLYTHEKPYPKYSTPVDMESLLESRVAKLVIAKSRTRCQDGRPSILRCKHGPQWYRKRIWGPGTQPVITLKDPDNMNDSKHSLWCVRRAPLAYRFEQGRLFKHQPEAKEGCSSSPSAPTGMCFRRLGRTSATRSCAAGLGGADWETLGRSMGRERSRYVVDSFLGRLQVRYQHACSSSSAGDFDRQQ